MKKIIYAILITILVIFVFFIDVNDGGIGYNSEVGQYTENDSYFYEYEYTDEEGYVIETEVESAEDCVSLEKYDPENSVCFIECDTPEQCDVLEDQLDKVLDELDSEFQEFSKDIRPFEGDASDLEEQAEVVYSLEKGEKFVIIYGFENENHKKVKTWLATISPNKFSDTYLSRLILYTKVGSDTMAYVTPSEKDSGKWDMYVNMDSMKDGEKEMVFTLIHEYVHILTLNDSQVVKDTPEGECQNYYVQEGCTNQDSYLNVFYKKYWEQYFNPLAEDPTENYEIDPSAFVTEYAAINPSEDIAESFTFFVFKKKGDVNTIAEQKVFSFYSYPELVEVRGAIRDTLKSIVYKRISL